MLTKPMFKSPNKIIPAFNVTSIPTSQYIGGRNCIISNISGNTWINFDIDATQLNGYKLDAGEEISLYIEGSISFVSDTTGSQVQILVLND